MKLNEIIEALRAVRDADTNHKGELARNNRKTVPWCKAKLTAASAVVTCGATRFQQPDWQLAGYHWISPSSTSMIGATSAKRGQPGMPAIPETHTQQHEEFCAICFTGSSRCRTHQR
jgi:hypothetical protein